MRSWHRTEVTPAGRRRPGIVTKSYQPSCLPRGSGAKLCQTIMAGDGMLLVTGGAGFIGSNVVAALNDAGRDVAVCDVLGHDGKWRNLAKRRLADVVPPPEL